MANDDVIERAADYADKEYLRFRDRQDADRHIKALIAELRASRARVATLETLRDRVARCNQPSRCLGCQTLMQRDAAMAGEEPRSDGE